MRVTHNSMIEPYQKALEGINNRKFKEEIRISTGKSIISISDEPLKAAEAKKLNFLIDRNSKYRDNIQTALNEIQSSHDNIQLIADNMRRIREYAVDATQIGNTTNIKTIAFAIKGMLTELVTNANTEINGHYIFSGTKTTNESIIPNPPEQDTMPFEIVQDTPTSANPSGLRVAFKGNMEDRIINRDTNSTEVINTKANSIFGENGTAAFQPIIDLYNLFMYNSSGAERADSDIITPEESEELNNLQKQIMEFYDMADKATAVTGDRITRLEAIDDQLAEENTRLDEYVSHIEDTDYTEAALNLAKEQNTLQFALQAGTRIIHQTLFDFLG